MALAGLTDDADLVRRLSGGEEEAFARIYLRYRRRVFSTAYRIMRDAADAQDATQEIFLKAYRALPSWNPDKSSLSTWLFRLASNHAIDCWRSRKRRLRAESGGEHLESSEPRSARAEFHRSPLRLLEAREAADMIACCIGELPDLQRRFVVLRYFGELTLAEIAELEGRSIGTVKGLLHRATHSVRRRLHRRLPS